MKTTILLCCASLLFLRQISGQTVPPGFTVTSIASGWVQPVGSAFTPDGQKLFVWEKRGQVYACNRNSSGNYIKQTTPVINISEEVGNWRDHGLLGVALDPQFGTNGYIYLLYVVDRHFLMKFGTPGYNANTNDYYKATIGRVTRYKTIISGGNLIADNTSRKVLIGETPQTGIPILYESHGVGTLVFAADGTLLVSAGDGASYTTVDPGSIGHTYYVQALADGIIRPEENVGAFRSQLLNSHCGKILRIDPSTGNGINSNPYYSAANPRTPGSRVWTLGLRNPFRITIKPGTGSTNPAVGDIGELYVADVGWNVWEELNVIDKPGMNCGWPLYEGLTQLNGYYNLSTANLDEPNPLFGSGRCTQQYFTFKDLLKQATSDNIKTVNNPCDPSQAIGTNNRYFHRRPMIDWKHGIDSARVGTFAGNDAATAQIGTPVSNVTGLPFRGNAAIAGCWYSGTSFPVNYRNTFFQADYGGDWLKSFKVINTDVLQDVQEFATGFAAIVAVTENPLDGSVFCTDIGNSSIKRIAYGGNQLPVVVMSANKTFGPSVLSVNFTGSSSFDPGGSITGYSWNFGDGTGISTLANPSHNFYAPPGTPTKYVVKLTVTDNQGGNSTDSMIISVNNTPPSVIISSPSKNSIYTLGEDTLYACTAIVTDAEHSDSELTYAWQSFLRHNNHQHPEPVDTNRVTQALISRVGCNGDDYYWLIRLTVTDPAGLSGSDSSKIYPACSNVSLALVLRNFSITQGAAFNLLKWTTEQEENIDYFEIERSTDGISFFPIQRENARNIQSTSTYSFPDYSFVPGVTYYRLKIIEKDGVIKYSMILRSNYEKGRVKLSVSPNPVTDIFSLVLNSPEKGKAVIDIQDINGRIIYSLQENVSQGNNIIYIKNLPNIMPGIYIISLKQGIYTSRIKFIKM